MHIDPYIVLGSAVVGMLVGLTGAGGGALMTPMLILLFGITPSSAISSDLVAAVLMRPVGAMVHLRKGTVNLRMVGWMVLGSVPMAFLGSFLLKELGSTSDTAQSKVEIVLGAALLVGAGAMVLRYILDRRSGNQRLAKILEIKPKPLATITIGAVGGLIVGLTSVGSGSLMIVLLLFLYPLIGANQLVGTDLTQAVPLTAAAALGALIFGHVEFGVTASIAIGSVPAVLIGSYLSSRAPDRFIRPIITFVIFASGLKYVGVGTTALGWILVIVALGGMATWLVVARPWTSNEAKRAPATATASAASQNGHATVTSAPNGAKPVNGTRSPNGTAPLADTEAPVGGHSAASDPAILASASAPSGQGSVTPADQETTAHSADQPEPANPDPTAADPS